MKYKKIIIILLIIIIFAITFIKNEQKFVFFNYLKETFNSAINYKINDYTVTMRIPKKSFIADYDISIKPHVKYYTFLSKEKIQLFHENIKEEIQGQYRLVFTNENFDMYLDDENKYLILIPNKFSFLKSENIIKTVIYYFPGKEDIKEILLS